MKKRLSIEKNLQDSLLKKGLELQQEHEILPPGELIRLFRMGLGMTIRQLASRANVPPSTVARIEKGRVRPNEETLKKIFNAMECDIAFIPVPRFKNIDEFLKERAKKIAEKRLSYLKGTMALEKQLPEEKWQEHLLENEIEDLLKSPSQLWDNDETL